MPNTIAHLGIQGCLTRLLVRQADLKWIYAGCILPDLPWILQRTVRVVYPEINRYDLLLYSSVQSSLFFCLILAGALALTTRRAGMTFLLLAISSTFHLLLDATQIKWANGVMLFAPLNWKLTSFNLYWPEGLPTISLTLFGLAYFLVQWKNSCSPQQWSFRSNRPAIAAAAVLLVVYLLAPPVFKPGPLEADTYYTATLLDTTNRTGKAIAFDRAYLETKDKKIRARNFNYEWFDIEGVKEEGLDKALISLKGHFLAPDRIKVTNYHLHPVKVRASASMVGLLMVLSVWLCALTRKQSR